MFFQFSRPSKVITEGGKITAMEFHRTEQNEDGSWIVDKEQVVRLKANYIISAFGSGLTDEDIKGALEPVKLNTWGLPEVRGITLIPVHLHITITH